MAKNISEVKAKEKNVKIVEKSDEGSSDDSDDSSVVSDSSSEEEISNDVTMEEKTLEKEDSTTDDDSSSVESSSEEEEDDEEEVSDDKEEEEEASDEEVSEDKEEDDVDNKDEVSEKEDSDKESSDEEDESDDEEEEVSDNDSTGKETPSIKNKKRPASDKQEEISKKVAKLNDGSAKAVTSVENTIYVGQIILSATVDDISAFFSKCGEIVDIRLGSFPNGQSKGYAYIDFSDSKSKSKAKALDGSELMGRPIKVSDATPPKDNSKSDKFIQKTDTVFIGNLSHQSNEKDIREAFEKFGTIKAIQVPRNNKADNKKGCIAFIKYSTKKEAANAVREMNNVSFQGRDIRLNYAANKKMGRGGKASKKK